MLDAQLHTRKRGREDRKTRTMALQGVSGPKTASFQGRKPSPATPTCNSKIGPQDMATKPPPKRQGRQKKLVFLGKRRHTEKCTQSKTVAKTIGSKHDKPRKSHEKLDFLPNPPARTSYRGFAKGNGQTPKTRPRQKCTAFAPSRTRITTQTHRTIKPPMSKVRLRKPDLKKAKTR